VPAGGYWALTSAGFLYLSLEDSKNSSARSPAVNPAACAWVLSTVRAVEE
jgi:hypothetical protein